MHQHHTSVAALAASATAQSGHEVVAVAEKAVGPAHTVQHLRLSNGLNLLLAHDPRADVFCYQTWFRVGSKDENPKRTGLAHLFEHLMFKGTKRFAAGTFDREMELRGAQTNAATWVDWTYYTQALATRGDNLQQVIDFESDRMVNLVLDEASFRSELEVVKNERRMSVDDAVGGALSEALMDLAFTRHSYRWPTIGSMAHLEASTLDDLRQFYRRHYAPNNATVVVVGNVDVVATATAVAKAYGPLRPQPVAELPKVQEPMQRGPRRRTLQRSVLTPQLVFGWHAPAQGSAAFYALEMLVDVLCDGDTARLYDRLVTRERLATDVSGFVTPFAEPGLVEVHVTAGPGADVGRIEAIVQEELGRLGEGIGAHEVDKARNGLLLAAYDGLRHAEGLAEALGHYQTTAGDFSRAFAAPEHYRALDAAALQRVAKQTFRPDGINVVVAEAGADAGENEAAGDSGGPRARTHATKGVAPWR